MEAVKSVFKQLIINNEYDGSRRVVPLQISFRDECISKLNTFKRVPEGTTICPHDERRIICSIRGDRFKMPNTQFHFKCERKRSYRASSAVFSVPAFPKHVRSCSVSIVQGNMLVLVAMASLAHRVENKL